MPQKLGQHFLQNESVLKNITQALELKDGDVVVEIGPGHGELTGHLISGGASVIAIERDLKLVDFLEKKFQITNSKLQINSKIQFSKNPIFIEGDALKILPILHTSYKLQDTSYKLVGNIPYYITGHLLRIVGELKHKPSKTVLLIQKEVAQRVCAKAPDSSLLSLSVQFWADCKIVEYVPKNDFLPPPKVDSAVIELITKKDVNEEISDRYYSFLKKAFKQPRKTLINNLVFSGADRDKTSEIIAGFSFNDKTRPQELSSKDAQALSLLF